MGLNAKISLKVSSKLKEQLQNEATAKGLKLAEHCREKLSTKFDVYELFRTIDRKFDKLDQKIINGVQRALR